jgi:cytochrome c oxidase cbb3-type subunit 3
MSSRFRSTEALLALALLATAGGCDREKREYATPDAPRAPAADTVRTSELQPGAPLAGVDAAAKARGRHFEGNAYHVNQGAQLFKWFNCTGCHANGGGAIGPALMDAQWRYGGSIEQIHASIAQGRPNGMPAFAGKIPDDQIWQVAAYVRTLSGNAPGYVAGGGRQGMAATPAPSRLPELEPKTAERGE